MKALLVFILVGATCSPLCAQDGYYSQFFSSPMTVNPAYTGEHDGEWRFVNNSRIQDYYYSDYLLSFSFAYDRPIEINKAKIGVGLLYTYDVSAGAAVPFQSLDLSASTSVPLSATSGLGFGLQLGYAYKHLSYAHLTFPEQYDRELGRYNEDFVHGEDFENTSSSYFNINFGMVYNKKFSKSDISTGFAVMHANKPEDFFLNIPSRVAQRYVLHGTYQQQLNEKVKLTPQFYYSTQNKASIGSIGMSTSYDLASGKDINSVSFGVYYQLKELKNASSLALMGGLKYKNWLTYMSFDLNMFSKMGGIHNQAVEFTFIYKRPSLKLKKTTVPWIRY